MGSTITLPGNGSVAQEIAITESSVATRSATAGSPFTGSAGQC